MKKTLKVTWIILVAAVVFELLAVVVTYSMYKSEMGKLQNKAGDRPEQYLPADLNDDNNGFKLLNEVTQIIKKKADELADVDSMDVRKQYFQELEKLDDEEYAPLVSYTDSLELVMEKVRNLTARKYCVDPVMREDITKKKSYHRPYYEMRRLIFFLEARAVLAAHRGDTEKVYESLRCFDKLKCYLTDEPYTGLDELLARVFTYLQLQAHMSCAKLLGEKFDSKRFAGCFSTLEFPVKRSHLLMWSSIDRTENLSFINPEGNKEDYPLSKSIPYILFPALTYFRKYQAFQYYNELERYSSFRYEELKELKKAVDGKKNEEQTMEEHAIVEACARRWGYEEMKALEHGARVLFAVMEFYQKNGEFPENVEAISHLLSPEDLSAEYQGEKLRLVREPNRLVVWGVPERKMSDYDEADLDDEQIEEIRKTVPRDINGGEHYMLIDKPLGVTSPEAKGQNRAKTLEE